MVDGGEEEEEEEEGGDWPRLGGLSRILEEEAVLVLVVFTLLVRGTLERWVAGISMHARWECDDYY